MNYLFTCSSCEKQFEISEKQAGMDCNCPFCETANTIPGMRAVRQLPPKVADEHKQKQRAGSASNETGSWLFSGGLLVAVAAGLCGIALLSYANQLSGETKIDEQIEWGRTQLDDLPDGHLLDAWESLSQGLPDWSESNTVRYNKQSAHLKNIAYGLFGLSALGLLAIIGSLATGKRSVR